MRFQWPKSNLRLVLPLFLALTGLLVCARTTPARAQLSPSTDPQDKVSSAKPAAQQSQAPAGRAPAADFSLPDDPTTLFSHPESAAGWLSGQANIILQWHPRFRAKYTGANSLRPHGENAISETFTLFTGVSLTHSTEFFVDPEIATGKGLSTSFGVAGFPNLDVVRNPSLSPAPYLARFMVRQIISLSDDRVAAQRGPFALASLLPARRLEIRAGKFSLIDFFDLNAIGSDSHLQFMNWTMDNNGAYDYAANTRGYTWGVLIEFDDRNWSLRFAETLMPKFANGIDLDADITRARAENLEFEYRGNFLGRLRPGRAGVIRLLNYVNHADMGSYREAIHAFLNHQDATPDITRHRRQGRIKYGFGTNFEQELTPELRVFGRFGWSEGHNESFAYTEVDQTIEFGGDFRGATWHRRQDKVGGAAVFNALSGNHRQYLALGGLGFLLGDGALAYGREKILEGYYTLHLWRGIFPSFDVQRIWNPGYNRDRGPVIVPCLRLHIDF